MSLATRCTACGTVFRVVQDQLRVSSGWVRCGRCGEVFNAIESLVDAAPERPEGVPSQHGPRIMAELARVSGSDFTPSEEAIERPAPAEAAAVNGHALPRAASDASTVPESQQGDGPGSDAEATEPTQGPRPSSSTAATMVAKAPAEVTASQRLGPPPVAAGVADMATPAFVVQADRAARWRRPFVRVVLTTLILVSASGLAAQILTSHHDWLAARWPWMQPVSARFCALQGCRVGAPRLLEGLSVDSSTLTKAPADGIYTLTVTVRNRAGLSVLAPALDLVLSDATGQPTVRRVLTLSELGVEASAIGAHSNLVASARVRIGTAPVLGYTIELFYP